MAAGGFASLFVRLTGSSYRILSRSYVVFLLLPVHLRRCSFPFLIIVYSNISVMSIKIYSHFSVIMHKESH